MEKLTSKEIGVVNEYEIGVQKMHAEQRGFIRGIAVSRQIDLEKYNFSFDDMAFVLKAQEKQGDEKR